MVDTTLLHIVFFVTTFAVVLLYAEGAKEIHSQKKNSLSSDFVFSDDDDLMLGDQLIESSGDGSDSKSSLEDLINEIPDLDPPTIKPPIQTIRSTVRPSIPPVRPVRPTRRPTQPEPIRRPCTSVSRPCSSVRRPCQSRRPCTSTRRPCRSRSRPCHTDRRPCGKTSQRCKKVALTKKRPVLPAYTPINMCGKTFHCREGYRGPCKHNEIFTTTPGLQPMSRPISSITQPTCSNHPRRSITLNGCISSEKRKPFELSHLQPSQGYCTLRFPSRPCYGYPSNYRYCQSTKQCYPALTTYSASLLTRPVTPSPCPANQFFMTVDQSYGSCRCIQPNYVRCQKSQRCYPAYTKGVCSTGEWLVPAGKTGLSTCQRSPCPSLADGRHIYWDGRGSQNGRPGCYQSNTQGPCRPGMRFVIEDIITGSSRCIPSARPSKKSAYESLLRDWYLYYGQ